MANVTTSKLAVLIDADNAPSSTVGALVAEIAKYGTASVKRAYGDWTGSNLKGWKDQLLILSIQPIQQFAYTQGKNSTDSAMIIDAMDLLYTGRFDGFCLVSSDSDFTRLAARIRESGLAVYGFGERKTPKPFVAACDKFIYIENLAYQEVDLEPRTHGSDSVAASRDHTHSQESPQAERQTHAQVRSDSRLARQLRSAVEAALDDSGWATLASVGHLVTKQYPDFDPRTYGYSKLSDLISASSLFSMTTRIPGEGKPPVIYVRDKKRPIRF